MFYRKEYTLAQEVIVIEKSKQCKDDSSQRTIVRNIWLNYYNSILLERGIITEKAYRQMKAKINSKYPTRKS